MVFKKPGGFAYVLQIKQVGTNDVKFQEDHVTKLQDKPFITNIQRFKFLLNIVFVHIW